MPGSVLSKSFTLSLLFHTGLVGLLVLAASRPPVVSDRPLRVRILEPTAPAPGPAPSAEPRAESRNLRDQSREPRAVSREGRQASQEPGAAGPDPGFKEAPAPPPPLVAARPSPEVAMPPAETTREARPDTLPPLPEQSGLSLGGALQRAPSTPPTPAGPPAARPARPSLRDQIASLGSGVAGEVVESAKQTINLDSRDARFVSYLARLKRRIENVWVYPEEAWNHGVGGESVLIFTLSKGGSLTGVSLVQSSGFPILDQEALRAVKLAAPYDSFPPQMGEEPWNIQASFRYNPPYRSRRN